MRSLREPAKVVASESARDHVRSGVPSALGSIFFFSPPFTLAYLPLPPLLTVLARKMEDLFDGAVGIDLGTTYS
jgi:hypothetical protein